MDVFIAVPSFSVQAQGYPKQKLAASGADAVGSTPEAFKAFIEAETLKWGKVIKDAKIVNQ